MTKKILTFISGCVLSLAAGPFMEADEGMWLPSLISGRIADMQAKGFRLEAKDIYDINQASLKDAVVLFGRGCTGEVISPEGLLLTNHHCGYGQIQKHSSVEHDYLKDGFWAMSRNEELPNKGLTVSFLERMEDVTERVLKGLAADMTEEERNALVARNSRELIKEATENGKGLRATVESLYYGNQYFIFIYKEFRDVRLVGAPPSAIGKFGGDTDNWMWPRHTGDFSIFRIYADKDNNPAEYSEDNVPYRPKRFFSISTKGVREGDFTFVYGFPGRTQEYIHSEGIRYIEDIGDPEKINLRTMRLDIQKKYMSASQIVRIQYSSKNASVANSWKKWQGEVRGLAKMHTAANKREYEAEFGKWAAGTEYEGITERIADIYRQVEPYSKAYDFYTETARSIELSRFAESIAGLYRSGKFSKKTLEETAGTFFKDYYLPIDKETFVAMMEQFGQKMSEDFKPSYFISEMEKSGGAGKWADRLFSESLFSDHGKVLKLEEADSSVVMGDPAVEYSLQFTQWFNEKIRPEMTRLNRELQILYRTYMRGQMEFAKSAGKGTDQFYPDANLTLRVAYGNVSGYSPADGIAYLHQSTIKGIMEKDDPEIFDYNIPQRLRDIYAAGDYGRWADSSGSIPVCFISTNHTTGGNSGSPVINGDGELIGINFDRVWEGTMSDLEFDPDVCRNIALDIRYVMFTIEKIGNASYLFDEISFSR